MCTQWGRVSHFCIAQGGSPYISGSLYGAGTRINCNHRVKCVRWDATIFQHQSRRRIDRAVLNFFSFEHQAITEMWPWFQIRLNFSSLLNFATTDVRLGHCHLFPCHVMNWLEIRNFFNSTKYPDNLGFWSVWIKQFWQSATYDHQILQHRSLNKHQHRVTMHF